MVKGRSEDKEEIMLKKVLIIVVLLLLVVWVRETNKFKSRYLRGVDPMQDKYKNQRMRMVQEQIIRRGIKDERVIKALREVKRHQFVPEQHRHLSYEDHPLAIGLGQTISQPYIVALMTENLDLNGEEKVLEVGTGSGYQAAILAELSKEVYTIEIKEDLANRSRQILQDLGYQNVHVRHGDGFLGWPEQAPFDAIIVTCAPEKIPEPLLAQLKEGGRLIIPVGDTYQQLKLVIKQDNKIQIRDIIPVRFVPMLRS